ncbi:hypothetical protein EJ08DRAFT_97220 [Tothia fuscella]|uniref:Secreted protein n=1 Tax=Tothia fuscella TaxID=1048955 RepID=A0A9P4NE59_9PEZI|nr:hypothetical protein EJ08DRAFT_97220 [Tothia fuscella]
MLLFCLILSSTRSEAHFSFRMTVSCPMPFTYNARDQSLMFELSHIFQETDNFPGFMLQEFFSRWQKNVTQTTMNMPTNTRESELFSLILTFLLLC